MKKRYLIKSKFGSMTIQKYKRLEYKQQQLLRNYVKQDVDFFYDISSLYPFIMKEENQK